MKRPSPRSCLALLCILCSCAALAQKKPISFKADSVESVFTKGKERTILKGRASASTESIEISADSIELFGTDFGYLTCSGSVVIKDGERKIKLFSPRVYYDRGKKLMLAQGPSVLEDEENALVLKAEWIESDGEKEITSAQVAVRILKKDLACRSEYAVYRRADKTLELSGFPSVYKSGDQYRALRILVNTETEEIRLEGDVSGSVAEKEKAQEDNPEARPQNQDAAPSNIQAPESEGAATQRSQAAPPNANSPAAAGAAGGQP